ncbi:MAG TPA: ABC transporter permease [Verrucomicrobiae bacterium]|jgi:putative ABC transport system permease protein|nr:ABC transporter permease [Verrucomicrobiae bacterium]
MLFAIFRIAIRALQRNALRTLLTMLGIIIGVGAVIAMVSIGNGAKAQIEARIASLGQNVIIVLSGSVTRGGFSMGFGTSPSLTQGDFDAIRKEVSGVEGASPEVRSNQQIAYGNQNTQVQVTGVGEDYVSTRSWTMENGNNFSDVDVRNANKVCLIGKTTAESLFGDGDPVGQIIRIKSAPFTVVGALAAKGIGGMGNDQDDIILVPYTSAMKRLSGGTSFRSLVVQASSPQEVPDVSDAITELLRQRHRIQEGHDDDFIIRTQQEIAETATATSKVMTLLLGSIAGVSLLVGGIGIMNIMLVSVTERTREIGVRLAVGARSGDILLQFLTEAVTLSVIGGLLGIAIGLLTSEIVSKKLEWPTLVSSSSIILAFAFSGAIGIFFGFYPARKAAQLDPIDALRYE